MESQKKCSMIDHKEIIAISFCVDCKIYMCNKCEKFHSELFKNSHEIIEINNNNITELFTGICDEKNHSDNLIYFCKNHNKLCCDKCLIKIKGKENEYGQHKDCDVFSLEEIETDKKNKLTENIKCLEELSKTLDESVNELKKIFDEVNNKKENLKIEIQKIFTKLRSALNDREDELILEVDKKYNDMFIEEDIIKDSEKLPKKIKESLIKGNLIKNQWDKTKLNVLIYECLNIENNITNIQLIKKNVEKYKLIKPEINFYREEEKINEFFESIKYFGVISDSPPKNFDSKIEFDKNLINIWLNNRNFKTELLFRKTRDGSTPKDFHNKCDNKGITIVFIETTKGNKFGGYTELQWDNSGDKKDNSTFIFSLDHKKKYTARNNNNSIACYSNEGPRFGCQYPEIYLPNSLNKGQSFDNLSGNTFLTGKKLTNGDSYWDVKELEVFKITYL